MEKAAHLNPLARLLRRRIERGGPISLAEYMTLALGHPEYGYYRTHDPLGAAGDFTTAPEISQIFGEILGGWCAVVWEAMGSPAPVLLVELGPGRGTLMGDALRVARLTTGFEAAVRLHLVETNETLRRAQQKALAAFRPTFHNTFADLPEGPLLLLANEFFDALPVRQFERTAGGFRERLVTFSEADSTFRFTLAKGMTPPQQIPARLHACAPGSVVEISLPALSLAHEIGRRVAAFGGAALALDYGSDLSKPGATFQSVRGHRRHDPLDRPGEADLSAHADFESLAEAARQAGARATATLPQGLFLERLGIHARAERLIARADDEAAERIRTACRRLIAAEEMGTLFRAFAIAHPDLTTLPGFDDSA